MWDYLCLFLVTGGVAQRESSDLVVKSQSLDFSYLRGYVATSNYVNIRFKAI